MTKIEIAAAFSHGQFEKAFPYLAEDVKWQVIEEDQLNGKEAVIQQCNQVAAYFASVETRFETWGTISDQQRVVVYGTAEFLRSGKSVSFISASDIYEFNEQNLLTTITSYCIQRKK